MTYNVPGEVVEFLFWDVGFDFASVVAAGV
jgi:hypothetical protein